MRTPFVAGNWKMNKTLAEAVPLVSELLTGLHSISSVERVICPPFTALMPISAMLEGTEVGLGAQNLYFEASGAYTGEESPAMIKEFCKYVIIGHSERRAYFGETDESVNKKVKAALAIGLIPIVCVGETDDENKADKTAEVINRQTTAGLAGLTDEQAAGIVVAYEPVWAIGSGRAASVEDAERVIGGMIRPLLKSMFGAQAAEAIRILYGGSVKGDNAADFFARPDIDGALVGGAALKAADFIKITQAAAR